MESLSCFRSRCHLEIEERYPSGIYMSPVQGINENQGFLTRFIVDPSWTIRIRPKFRLYLTRLRSCPDFTRLSNREGVETWEWNIEAFGIASPHQMFLLENLRHTIRVTKLNLDFKTPSKFVYRQDSKPYSCYGESAIFGWLLGPKGSLGFNRNNTATLALFSKRTTQDGNVTESFIQKILNPDFFFGLHAQLVLIF